MDFVHCFLGGKCISVITKDTLKDVKSQTDGGLFKILFDVACSTVSHKLLFLKINLFVLLAQMPLSLDSRLRSHILDYKI